MNIIQIILDKLYIVYKSINGPIRESTYFSLLSILVSVAIFAADQLKNDKKSIEKRMIVSNLPIRATIIISIITNFLLWFSNIEKIEEVHPVVFNIYQIVVDILILASYYHSIVLIYKAINFSSNETYYDNNLKRYIEEQEIQINKETRKIEEEYLISDIEFEQLFRNLNCKRFEDYDFILDEDKIAISANFNGLIKKLNINTLDKYCNYCNKPIQDEETLYLKNCLGQYINKGDIVAYCNIKYEKIYLNIDNFFIVDKKYEPFQRRYAEINELLFDKAPISNGVFDSDNYINHTLEHLYLNKCITGKDILIDKIASKLYENEEDIVFINQYKHFIKYLMITTMKYDDINAYIILNNLWNTCNYIRLKKEEDKLINDYLQYINRDIYDLKYRDKKFYDACMSAHLKFIYLLIKNDKFDQIFEILKSNLAIYDTNENEEKSLINLSFICGVIKGLIYKDSNNKNDIKRILDLISENVSYYEGCQFIDDFRKIEKKCNYTYKVLSDCDFYIENYKNGEEYIDSIDNISLLLQIIDLFGICDFDKNIYEKLDYSKEDKAYYSSLFDAINKEYSNDKNHRSLKKESNIKDYINYAINQSTIKEEEYIKTLKIDSKQLCIVKNDIKNVIVDDSRLLNFLNNNDYIVGITNKIEKSFICSKLIPRKYIVDYDNNKDFILYQFKGLFSDVIINNYCNIISNKFKSYSTIEEFSQIMNNDDYVIFINEEVYYEKLIDKINNNRIVINGKSYNCFHHLKNIINIIPVKFSDLPLIFVNNYNNRIKDIKKSCLIEIYDMSNNDDVRKEFIKEFGDKYKEDKLVSYVLLRTELMYEINVKV